MNEVDKDDCKYHQNVKYLINTSLTSLSILLISEFIIEFYYRLIRRTTEIKNESKPVKFLGSLITPALIIFLLF